MATVSCTTASFTGLFKREFDQWRVSESVIGKSIFVIRDFSRDKITLVFKRQAHSATGESPCPTEMPAYRIYIAPFQEGEKIREIFNGELYQRENSNSYYYYSRGDNVEFDLTVNQKLSANLNLAYQPA